MDGTGPVVTGTSRRPGHHTPQASSPHSTPLRLKKKDERHGRRIGHDRNRRINTMITDSGYVRPDTAREKTLTLEERRPQQTTFFFLQKSKIKKKGHGSSFLRKGALEISTRHGGRAVERIVASLIWIMVHIRRGKYVGGMDKTKFISKAAKSAL